MARPVDKGIPTVVHLHGGHTESASDGLPEQWFTQNFAVKGPTFVKENYYYENTQEAATLWYHDHALGITRLNVYAGLAGFYLLTDNNEENLQANNTLPSGEYDIEIVLQDRMFSDNGELFYPSTDPDIIPNFNDGTPTLPLPPGPSAIAEFFGDFIVVNGMVWPKLDVEPRQYRFRMLNGSDSRFYILQLSNGNSFYVIGTDDGLLENPVTNTQLLIAPGERYDIVVDFTGMAQRNRI